jgi:hypothetical protein
MPENTPFFTRDELKKFRYRCSHKLAVSLTVGAIYLAAVTAFALNKALHNTPAAQDRLQYFGLAAAGYILLVGLFGLIVRRSQSLNFSRFLNGCVKLDKIKPLLEYVELRMPEPFSPRFLKHPVHLMILGKVLEHSEKPDNAEAGRRMIEAAVDRDPALEPFRGAELADLMKYHETFLSAHPEMLKEWRNAESFHALLVHFILPVVIIVGIVAFILKGCEPPDPEALEDNTKAPAAETVREADGAAPSNEVKADAAPASGAEVPAVTAPETESAPQA